MKDKKDKENIFKRIMSNNSKQSEIDNLDVEQRNYKPKQDLEVPNPNPIRDLGNGMILDLTNLVETLKTLETKVGDKQIDKNNNLNKRSEENLEFVDKVKKITSEVIQRKRKEANLTQQQVSETGYIARSYLSDIENGKTEISVTTLLLVSKALNINPSNIINEIYEKISNVEEGKDFRKTNISQPRFIKNIYIQIGVTKSTMMTVYVTDKGNKIIMGDEDFSYYKNKYGKNVFFYMDRKEQNVILGTPVEKTDLKFKINYTDVILEKALPYK